VRFDILTLFPGIFAGVFSESIIGRAVTAGLLEVHTQDIRAFATDKHRVCDDYPYGGGPGMVMKPEPIFAAVEAVAAADERRGPVVLLTPRGRLLTQAVVNELAAQPRLILICGHYEGIDERVGRYLATDELSIGDYVLSGGEPAAIVVVDAVARRLPGVLGDVASLAEESHGAGLLEYPQYTRPAEFRGWQVPATLLSGHHAEVDRWRRRRSILRTAQRRPDLPGLSRLTQAEQEWLIQELARPPQNEDTD